VNRARWAATFVGLLGTAQILVLTRNGPGIAPDSVDYVAGAMSLAAGRGYSDIANGNPIFTWPPLFSAAMAGVHRLTGLPVVESGRWLNAVTFGGLAATALLVLWEQTGSVLITGMGTTLVLAGTPLVGTAAALLSEPLFCLLVLWCCLALRSSGETGAWPWAAGMLAGLAAITRYAGGFLIPCGALLLAARWRRAAVYAGLGLTPVLAWGWRNWQVVGSFSGPRHPSTQGWAEVLPAVVKVFSRWVVPERVPFGWRAALLAGAVVGGAAMVQRAWRDPETAGRRRRMLGCCLVVTAGYVGAMVAAATQTALPAFNDRYLAPVYVLLVVAGATVLARERKWLRWAALGWCLFPVWRYGTATAAMLREDRNPLEANFNDRRWRESLVWGWVREAGAGKRLYSNAADAIWFHTGVAARSAETGSCPAGEECYLVWFERVTWRMFPAPEALGAREVRRFPEARVYVLAK
jgi:hypothetical protein